MSENGISPIEAGLRIEEIPFDLQTADELYMIVFSWMSSRNKIEPTSNIIEHVGASFIYSFSNAKRHADEMLSCFNNNDENLHFKNPKDTTKSLNSRLKISGVKTWCSERGLILPEPFPQEIAKIIKELFYCHSEKDEYSAWWDIATAKEYLEIKKAGINAKKYQYEERKQLDLVPIEQQIALLDKYLSISSVNYPEDHSPALEKILSYDLLEATTEKLLDLKDWHTVKEAAVILASLLETKITMADVYRMVLDGKLNLHINFINTEFVLGVEPDWPEGVTNSESLAELHGRDKIEAYPVKPVWVIDSNLPQPLQNVISIYMSARDMNTNYSEDEIPWKFNNFVSTIRGVHALSPVGAGQAIIEQAYHELTTGIKVQIPLKPLFIVSDTGILGAICENVKQVNNPPLLNEAMRDFNNVINLVNINFKEQGGKKMEVPPQDQIKDAILYVPTNQLPIDSQFIITSASIKDLLDSINPDELTISKQEEVAHSESDKYNVINDHDESRYYSKEELQYLAEKEAKLRMESPEYIVRQRTRKADIASIIIEKYKPLTRWLKPATDDYIVRRFNATWQKNKKLP